jgi:FGGY family of carbohydrate kinases, N-terminal domain
MNYLLAYDFGTGGIKASLYDEAGQCVADGFDGYPTYYPAPGFHEQEPEAWWQATISSTHKLLATLSAEVKQQIVGIGISGHSLGVVPLDKDGKLLRDRTPIWSDARAGEEAKQVFQRISEIEWYRMTGNGFPAGLYSAFKLMWFKEHEPEMFKQIAVVLGTKDYINYKLAGGSLALHAGGHRSRIAQCTDRTQEADRGQGTADPGGRWRECGLHAAALHRCLCYRNHAHKHRTAMCSIGRGCAGGHRHGHLERLFRDGYAGLASRAPPARPNCRAAIRGDFQAVLSCVKNDGGIGMSRATWRCALMGLLALHDLAAELYMKGKAYGMAPTEWSQ